MPSNHDHRNIIIVTAVLFSVAFLVAGLFVGDILSLPGGLLRIWTSPAPINTDFTEVGGLNAALVNAGIMGLAVVVIYRSAHFQASGGAFGAFFLSLGLGLVGKTPLTLAPFLLGGFLYAKYRREPFRRVLLYPIQAAALSPIVSVLMFHGGFSLVRALVGVLSAVIIGFVITPVSTHTRTMHRGFDLFNVGLAAGLIGVCFFALFRSIYLANGGAELNMLPATSDGHSEFFIFFLGGLFLAVLAAGLAICRSFKPFLKLRAHTGLDIDFVQEYGIGAVLCNMGFVGLMMLAYMLLVRAPFTGLTAGAMMCVLCWTGSGANTRNVLPVLVGYIFAAAIMQVPLNSPYLCIAVCYATGLAPMSGRFGGIWGIVSGMMHAFLSDLSVSMHGGFNLYNGGFTAGLTALVLYPIVHNLSRHEYTDNTNEPHPGLVMELAGDVVHLAESAKHLVHHDSGIVPELPEEHRETKTKHTFLTVRNLLAILAGLLFFGSLMPFDVLSHYGHIFKFIAYILGAGAYGSEIIVLTDGFRHDPGITEMLMPYLFGLLYVLLGLNYLLGGH